MKKPKFKVGQVVAQLEYEGLDTRVVAFYVPIKEKQFLKDRDCWEYKFNRGHMYLEEKNVRALNKREKGI